MRKIMVGKPSNRPIRNAAITVRVLPETKAALEALAIAEGRSLADLVNRALEATVNSQAGR